MIEALKSDEIVHKLGGRFTLLTIDAEAEDEIEEGGVTATRLALSTAEDKTGALAARYLGDAKSAVYLIRPDQHVAARFPEYNEAQIRFAIRRATGKE